ncbi:formate dehydrogenase subunit gamma [Pseudoxanthobacter sp.]|uniref:formate dehydrogenase subunit gamma n=1 Tax=Pseudoxanthobacter sp. TaxID=1925742 RepID=UPI002FE2375A
MKGQANGPGRDRGTAAGPDSGVAASGSAVAVAWDEERAAAIIAARAGEPGALLPILHDLQAAFGYVPRAALPLVAEGLNISRAEVHGVVTFYHDFRDRPAGRHVLRLCRAEACQAMGCDSLHAGVLAGLGLGWGETSADGELTVEPVYCLGLCATGPAAMVDDRLLSRTDERRLRLALAAAGCRAGEGAQ